jgi:hypothetical protein
MSLQKILENSETVLVNDHRFVGQSVSRNQRITTSEINSVVPFSFDLKPHNFLLYSKNRAVLADLRKNDKAIEQYLNFGSTGWLNFIKYQGDMTSTQIASCTFTTASNDAAQTLVMSGLPALSASAVLLKAGDFVQIGRYTYIVTADVLRGGGTTVNVYIHRNRLTTLSASVSAVIGQYGTVTFGTQTFTGITFPVILREFPDYTLVAMSDDSFIQWSGVFRAFEAVL